MPKILHIADLHLRRDGDDRTYGLSVLEELVNSANAKGVSHILICGDFFDSFADFSDKMLNEDVKSIFERLSPQCEVIYITGNHEVLGKKQAERLAAYNFGRIRLVSDNPCFLEEDGIEFLAVPFRSDYSYLLADDFPKKKHFRIVMMHGTDASVYIGPDSECDETGSETAQISDILLSKLQADYAALGHIHERRFKDSDGINAAYPGSSRVWRKGEKGPRKAIFIEISGNSISNIEEMTVNSAGQYREIIIPIGVDGSYERSIEPRIMIMASKFPNDWFELVFSGVTEDYNSFESWKFHLHSMLSKKIRKCTLNTLGVETMSALADNPTARFFLDAMEKRKPSSDGKEMDAWLQARILGLKQINDAINNS